jgi:uncharacterized protein (DUF1697 family)
MPTHVALLRGINLGSRNRVAMADLRALVGGLGHTDVSTYIQSGNVLFTAARTDEDTAAIADALTEAIAAGLGVTAPVVVLRRDELDDIIAANPFPDEPNPKCVHAVVFGAPAGPELQDRVEAALARSAALGSPDDARVAGRALYLHTPGGFGRSKLAELLTRAAPRGGANGTARNWATVLKLRELCELARVTHRGHGRTRRRARSAG